MSDSIKLHDTLSSAWSDNYKKRSFMKRRLAFLDLLASLPADFTSVLDLGCGAGDLSSYVKHSFSPALITCADGSEYMLNRARMAHEEHANVDFICSPNFLFLADKGKTYTLVYSSSVLEYIRDIGFVVGNLEKRLVPNGFFVFSLPNRFSFLRIYFIVKRFFLKRLSPSSGSAEALDYLDYSINFSSSVDFLFDPSKFQLVTSAAFDPFLPRFMRNRLFKPFFSMTLFAYRKI